MLITQPLERVFITSDHHFGHANIINYANRPFVNLQEMDENLIAAWNSVVKPDDWVYHLGDFTLGDIADARKYLLRLNGIINILFNPWHHDKRWLSNRHVGIQDDLAIGVQNDLTSKYYPITLVMPVEILEISKLTVDGRAKPVVLCHYPFASWDRSHYQSWHLFGHCHNQYRPSGLSMDAGVDAAYKVLGVYRPFSLAEIANILSHRSNLD